ncbi:uncharacterized protein LOC121390672 [Gigantopelta aegis]|uniref:uncharacterized protein LOC121390672 n=1 Tax=Gigantopelta aegis TaxID=1735272 RepID=UPI001B88CEFC|nr:uncharacterized protein LOC121390672 [Gigantopelta aegis]
MNTFIVLSLLFTTSLCQFLPSHRGDFVSKFGDYTIEYHDEKGLLLIVVRLDCYVIDAPPGSPVAKILDDPLTRNAFLPKVIQLIEKGTGKTSTSIQELTNKYHDTLVRALCFVTEVYKLDVNSLLHS